jgi:hypothetical protein
VHCAALWFDGYFVHIFLSEGLHTAQCTLHSLFFCTERDRPRPDQIVDRPLLVQDALYSTLIIFKALVAAAFFYLFYLFLAFIIITFIQYIHSYPLTEASLLFNLSLKNLNEV